MNFPDSPGKEQNVLTTQEQKSVSVRGLTIKPSVPPLYGPFSATFGAQTVLSELESIGRSNLTWPASPATELGRTVLLWTVIQAQRIT